MCVKDEDSLLYKPEHLEEEDHLSVFFADQFGSLFLNNLRKLTLPGIYCDVHFLKAHIQ